MQSEFEILRIALLGLKAHIGADNHFCFKLVDERLKHRVRDVRRLTRPAHDQARFVQQQAEFTADNPAMIRDSFSARSGVR